MKSSASLRRNCVFFHQTKRVQRFSLRAAAFQLTVICFMNSPDSRTRFQTRRDAIGGRWATSIIAARARWSSRTARVCSRGSKSSNGWDCGTSVFHSSLAMWIGAAEFGKPAGRFILTPRLSSITNKARASNKPAPRRFGARTFLSIATFENGASPGAMKFSASRSRRCSCLARGCAWLGFG